LPPVSEGEDSITEGGEAFEPSFKWVATQSSTPPTSQLIRIEVEPKKVERGKVNHEWKGIVELLLYNVERHIHLRADMIEF
jgi:hypothetical protein